jgi:hypothetical protein
MRDTETTDEAQPAASEDDHRAVYLSDGFNLARRDGAGPCGSEKGFNGRDPEGINVADARDYATLLGWAADWMAEIRRLEGEVASAGPARVALPVGAARALASAPGHAPPLSVGRQSKGRRGRPRHAETTGHSRLGQRLARGGVPRADQGQLLVPRPLAGSDTDQHVHTFG